jgi:hypothetical protein
VARFFSRLFFLRWNQHSFDTATATPLRNGNTAQGDRTDRDRIFGFEGLMVRERREGGFMVSGSWTKLSLLLQMFHFCIFGMEFLEVWILELMMLDDTPTFDALASAQSTGFGVFGVWKRWILTLDDTPTLMRLRVLGRPAWCFWFWGFCLEDLVRGYRTRGFNFPLQWFIDTLRFLVSTGGVGKRRISVVDHSFESHSEAFYQSIFVSLPNTFFHVSLSFCICEEASLYY